MEITQSGDVITVKLYTDNVAGADMTITATLSAGTVSGDILFIL